MFTSEKGRISSESFQLPALKSMDTDCIAAEKAYTER